MSDAPHEPPVQTIELTTVPTDQVPDIDWFTGEFKIVGVKRVIASKSYEQFDYVKLLILPNADPIDPAVDPILIKPVMVKQGMSGWSMNVPVFYALWRNVAWKFLGSEQSSLHNLFNKVQPLQLKAFSQFLDEQSTITGNVVSGGQFYWNHEPEE
jgi:hypothetical protein